MHLVYSHTFEGLIRALGNKVDPGVAQKLKDVGVDIAQPLKSAYPQKTWFNAVAIAAKALRPDDAPEEAEFQFGKRFVYGFGNTVVGKGMLWVARLAGPRKMLEQLNKNLRAGNNYTETKLSKISGNEYELWVGHIATPHFIRGLCFSGLEVAGAVDGTVDVTKLDENGITFRVRWGSESRPLPITNVRA